MLLLFVLQPFERVNAFLLMLYSEMLGHACVTVPGLLKDIVQIWV